MNNVITSFFSFGIFVLQCLFILFFKFPFPSDKIILFLWSLIFNIKYILCQNQFVSLHLFVITLSQVTFCWLLIVLLFPVWHQDFSLLLLDHCWGYYWLRAVHPAKQSILKCSYALILVVIQILFSQLSTDFSPLKNTTRLYNTLIQHTNLKMRSFQKSGKEKS